ncbi:MAG: DUF4142 domain-containing protein [Caulobacteraceae bacterium]|nr:DUF4142 domain-containing protein [Caulobacteraceae bacterium]
MIRKAILISAGVLSLAAASSVRAVDPAPPSATTDFITKAAQSDEFERTEGRLAEKRATDSKVRSFAAEMVTAHTKTTEDLKKAIRAANMTPPPPPPLAPEQKQMLAELRAQHGARFDKTYIDQQVQAHQATLGVVQSYAQTGGPGPIRDAAQATAPLVQHHLDMAKDIQSHLGG